MNNKKAAMILRCTLSCFAMTALSALAPLPASSAEWSPSRNVEIVIPSGPGSGTDIIGRMIQHILSGAKLVSGTVVAMNKSGGGGAVALNYIEPFKGNAHYLYISSPTLLTSYLTGTTKFTYTHLSPIAQLFNEYVVFSVAPNSSIRDAKDLIDRLRRDPSSVTVGLATALGNANHIAIGLATKAAGGAPKDLTIAVYRSGGEGLTAVMGGHIDVNVIGAIAVVPQMQSGRLRPIAITSPRRMTGALAQIPTLKESGLDVVSGQWRGIVGPGGLNENQLRYWDDAFSKLVTHDDWQKMLSKSAWESMYMDSKESRKFLDKEFQELKGVLGDLGLAK